MLSLRFEWDPAKSDATFERRKFDFHFASLVFSGMTVERDDGRRDYGERRIIAIGVAQGIHLSVVYTDRKAAPGQIVRRIISARRSNSRERTRYQKEVDARAPHSRPGEPGVPS